MSTVREESREIKTTTVLDRTADNQLMKKEPNEKDDNEA